MRKLVTILAALIVIGIGVFAYFSVVEIQRTQLSPWKAVPGDAQAIITINDPLEEWSKVSANSVMWQALTDHGLLVEMGTTLDTIYAMASRHPELGLDKNAAPLVISFTANSGHWNYLLSYSLPISVERSMLQKLLEKQGFSASAAGFSKGEWKLDFVNGLLLATTSDSLLTSAVAQTKSDFDIPKPEQFSKGYKIANASTAVNLYFTPKASTAALNYFLGVPADWSQFAARYGGITELDIRIKPNALTFNGYSWNASDTAGTNYLHNYIKQSAKASTALDYMPEAISAFMHFNFSDYTAFRKSALAKQGKDLDQIIARASEQLEMDVQTHLLDWMEGEMVSGFWQRNPKSAPVFIGLVKSNDIASAKASLQYLEAANSDEEYIDHRIARIEHDELLRDILGEGFSPLKPAHYTTIDDFVIFATSIQHLKGYLNKIIAEKTLRKNIHFDRFNDHLSGSSNAFFYTNLARSLPVYKRFASKSTYEQLSKNEELLQLFEGLSWQMSHEGNGQFYNSIYFKHNPTSKLETYTLWETPLDTIMRTKPWIVRNHYTKSNEILMQDVNNRLYLLDGKGNILWRRDIDGAVVGEVHQIDVFKNNKLQMLFNTKHSIYLIDRLGRDVEGFPVRLNSPATNALAVMDYDQDKTYRILIACENNKILNYDRRGKLVKGWKSTTKAHMQQPLTHISVKGKDYIVSVDVKGNIYALSRKGKERLNLKNKAALASNSDFSLTKGKTKNNTFIEYSDTTGSVHRITLSDSRSTSGGAAYSPAAYFNSIDMDGNAVNEYVFVDSNEVNICDNDFAEFEVITLDSTYLPEPYFYQFGGKGTHKIGFVDPINEEISLYTGHGMLVEGFPLTGASPFTIADINRDGQLELVVAGKDALIYAYALEDGE